MNAFKLAREMDNMKLKDVQARCGMHFSLISQIENNRVNPTRKEIIRLVSVLPSYKKAVEIIRLTKETK